jgi:hypothetical protein
VNEPSAATTVCTLSTDSKCPEPFLSVGTKRCRIKVVPGLSSAGAVPEMVTGAPAGARCVLMAAVPPHPTTLGVRVNPAAASFFALSVTAVLDPPGPRVAVPVVVNWYWNPTNSGLSPPVE